MLTTSRVEANIPAADLTRARTFYAEKLGLEPERELPGPALTYRTAGGTRFNLYETSYAGRAGHTVAQWHVDDLAAEVAELKSRGVAFEHYDLPGTEWDGDVAVVKGMGRAAWFTDSEGNVMCLDQEEPAG